MFQIGDVCTIVNAGHTDGKRVTIISDGYLIDGSMRFRVKLNAADWPPHGKDDVIYALAYNLRYDSARQKATIPKKRTHVEKVTQPLEYQWRIWNAERQRAADELSKREVTTQEELKGVAQLNREIWASLHPDPPPYLWTQKHAVQETTEEADEDEEDWRPYFLRRIPIPSREWTESESATYQTYDYFRAAQAPMRRDIRCSDESEDDWNPYRHQAEDEPRPEPKVTTNLLHAWHKIGYR